MECRCDPTHLALYGSCAWWFPPAECLAGVHPGRRSARGPTPSVERRPRLPDRSRRHEFPWRACTRRMSRAFRPRSDTRALLLALRLRLGLADVRILALDGRADPRLFRRRAILA